MNSSSDCHEIEGCPYLFVDAFKGSMLRKTSNINNTFILSHYHSDHYQNLPKEFKYKGPAFIHCTSITASLLRDVHEVPSNLVVEHKYGETWHLGNGDRKTKITFYDANHCPGAAIILIELPDKRVHLHCGDMRYKPQMRDYTLIKKFSREKKFDLIYLDSTYGHPKHDFGPQSEAIEKIAKTVEEELEISDSTLILLSCYSIGKEKVLRECSARTNQPIFVSDRKLQMLQCCNEDMSMFTLDPRKTNIHVVRMGLAGDVWPYFQPNYPSCLNYVENLQRDYGRIYHKVIAFVPTGWANSSNWNKKNSVASKCLPLKTATEEEQRIEIEVRLISYSEHSSFKELVEFIAFLKPRQVIPTVFSDDNDRLKILKHFRHLVDQSKAKQKFFESMHKKSTEKSLPSYSVKLESVALRSKRELEYNSSSKVLSTEENQKISLPSSKKKVKLQASNNASESDRTLSKTEWKTKIRNLESMGFTKTAVEEALVESKGKIENALDCLLVGSTNRRVLMSNNSSLESGIKISRPNKNQGKKETFHKVGNSKGKNTLMTSFFNKV